MSDITVVIYKDSKTKYDISEIVQKVVWSGRDGTPTRSIDVTFVNNPSFKKFVINTMSGYKCYFKYKGKELFRGFIKRFTANDKKTSTFKAYDIGFYLSNNKDAYSFKKKTADYIFKKVCKNLKLSVGSVSKCKKTIKELSEQTTAWDIIQTALSKEFHSTRVRHSVVASKGKLNLITRKKSVVKWILEVDRNITAWNYTDNSEKVKTRVKLYSSKGKTLATRKSKTLEKRIGILQDISREDEDTKKSKLKSSAKSLLKDLTQPERNINITATGITAMTTGRCAYCIIPDLSIKRSFYIVSDTHTFDNGKYTMSLKLENATDLDY